MRLKKTSLIAFAAAAALLCASVCMGGQETTAEMLLSALNSNNPQKVDTCLDRCISENNYSGILRIRNHSVSMIRSGQRGLMRSNVRDEKVISKALAPWIAIDKKASGYFIKKQVTEDDRQTDSKSLYHR